MFGRYRNYSSHTGINEYLPEKEPYEKDISDTTKMKSEGEKEELKNIEIKKIKEAKDKKED